MQARYLFVKLIMTYLSAVAPHIVHPAAAAAAAGTEVDPYQLDLLNTSYYPTRADAANSSKRWYIIDAEGQTLGRLATLAATYVRSADAVGTGAA